MIILQHELIFIRGFRVYTIDSIFDHPYGANNIVNIGFNTLLTNMDD
jgi:hypothetical protein